MMSWPQMQRLWTCREGYTLTFWGEADAAMGAMLRESPFLEHFYIDIKPPTRTNAVLIAIFRWLGYITPGH
jgi:hypothetical protein